METKEMRDSKGRFMKGNTPWTKGHQSPIKNKIYEEIYGEKKAKEIKTKQSKSKIGEKNHNYGNHLKLECRKKLSIAHKRIEFSEEHRRKISESKKGHIVTEETKRKISESKKGIRCSTITEFKKGKDNLNFNDYSSFEPYDKTFNNKFKRGIRKRDNQVCMLCGIHREKLKKSLEIHHINYDKKLSIPQNCISLCKKCHTLTNYNREYWIKFFQSLLLERYCYKYSNQEIILKMVERRINEK